MKYFRSLPLSVQLLLVALVLFDLACWFDPSLLDRTLRRLDFRLWPSWWFFAIGASVTVFYGWRHVKNRSLFLPLLGVMLLPGQVFAAEKKIVQIEPPKRITAAEIKKSSQAESEKNADGGYNANTNVVDSFAAMEYRYYTGGRYTNEPIKFRLLSPDDVQSGKTYPLLICFHGKGESGDDNTRQLAHLQSTIELLAGKNKLDIFVLVTQCPEDNPYWDVSLSNEGKGDAPITILEEILNDVLEEYPIDAEKICVYGHCSGGNAAWQFVDTHPGTVAALVVCSAHPGGSAPESFLKTSVWAFHNKDDDTPSEPTELIVEEINALGGNAFLTLNETGGHDSWSGALGKNKAVLWMALQTLGKTGPPQGVTYVSNRSSLDVFMLFVLPIVLIVVQIVLLRRKPKVNEKS